MKSTNTEAATIKQTLVPIILLVLLVISPTALADDGQQNCSLEVSLMAERVKDDNPEDDWSFVILTGTEDEKTYHRVEVASQEKSNQSTDEEKHISSTETLVERKFYTLYSTEYTGKEEVFVGVQAIGNGQENIQDSGFGSTKFNLNCEEMFTEEVGNVVMSTLEEHEFKVTATENEGQKSGSATVWNVSVFISYSGQHKPKFKIPDLAKPLGVLLWLGWSWHVIF